MRLLRVVGLAVLFAAAAGCGLFEKIRPNPGKTTPVPQVTSADLVNYLNSQSGRLNSVTYGQVRVTAKQGLVPLPALRGDLAAVQPRSFRMRGQGGAVSSKIDLGSNNEQFWLFVDAPTVRPTFVFASHTDFESGRAKIPEGIPFEPDWVLQALGMTTFPRDAKYDVKLDDRARTYTLSWPATTPNGMPIRKEVVFLADDADSSRDQPQVKRHIIRDTRGNIICSAEVKKARTVSAGGAEGASGRSVVVQYPLQIVLRWEKERFEMDLSLDEAKVNPHLTDEMIRTHFSRPTIQGTTPINLTEARFEVPGR